MNGSSSDRPSSANALYMSGEVPRPVIFYLFQDYGFLSAVSLCFPDTGIQHLVDQMSEIDPGGKQRELILGSDN